MEISLVSLKDYTKNQELLTKIKIYKNQLKEQKELFKTYEEEYYSLEKQQVDSLQEEFLKTKKNDENFIQTGQILSDGVKKLNDATRVAYETDFVAIGIENQLQKNQEQLNRALRTAKEIGGELTFVNKIMTLIEKQRITNKILLYIIGVFMIFSLILILYFNFV